MKRLFGALLIALLVAGCSRVELEAEQIKQAEELCKDNGGVESINKLHDWFYPNYVCNNGTSFEIYGHKITKSEPIK